MIASCLYGDVNGQVLDDPPLTCCDVASLEPKRCTEVAIECCDSCASYLSTTEIQSQTSTPGPMESSTVVIDSTTEQTTTQYFTTNPTTTQMYGETTTNLIFTNPTIMTTGDTTDNLMTTPGVTTDTMTQIMTSTTKWDQFTIDFNSGVSRVFGREEVVLCVFTLAVFTEIFVF